jgi:hypothetical protein
MHSFFWEFVHAGGLFLSVAVVLAIVEHILEGVGRE